MVEMRLTLDETESEKISHYKITHKLSTKQLAIKKLINEEIKWKNIILTDKNTY